MSHKIDFATLGNATKTYFVPSALDITASTNDIAGQTSMTITTSNANSAILVTVEAVMNAVGGQDFYPRVVVDGTNYGLATRNLQGNASYSFTRIIPNLSAGPHTVSFGLSPNGTVRFAAYNDIHITAIEIAPPIQ